MIIAIMDIANIKKPRWVAGLTCSGAGIHSFRLHPLPDGGGDKHCGFIAVFITMLLWVSAALQAHTLWSVC